MKSSFRAVCAVLLVSSSALAQTRDDSVTRCRSADADAAIAACTKLIESGEGAPADLAGFVHNRGNAHMDRGNLGSAIEDYERAAALDPRFASDLLVVANLLRASGDEVGALQYHDEAIRRSPTAAMFAARGSLYVTIGDMQSAVADYDRAVALEPESANILAGRCVANFRSNNAQAAVTDCSRALALRPGSLPALDSRAYAYLKLGQLKEAIADCNTALALEPQRITSLYARGLAKRKSGDTAGGDADIAAAAAILPDIANRMERVGVTP